MKPITINCFKAYDVRGRLPDELNESVVYRIGRAYVDFLQPTSVVVGRDIRESSERLTQALIDGLTDGGTDVLDIGLCGTEEVYFATFSEALGGGIMVTASHNPADFNGLKFVREQSKPISGESGLEEIRALAEAGKFLPATKGTCKSLNTDASYIEHLLGYIDISALKPLKIVVNPGNGGAGKVVDLLRGHLPFEFVEVHYEADSSFPNGVPNPLLTENRSATIDAIRAHGADLGIAWDGDYDRCFFFDEKANFVEGYYLVGLLGSSFLKQQSGQSIVHDPRLTWNTIDIAKEFGGTAVQSRTGHAFLKKIMRDVDAVYGGEMSAHHYFRDFAYCDSGMIPWLLVSELISKSGKSLSQLVGDRVRMFPASGEINRTVKDAKAMLALIEERYAPHALMVEHVDGLSIEYADWRFNLRSSNTEPVMRLNVESRGDTALMLEKTNEILGILDAV